MGFLGSVADRLRAWARVDKEQTGLQFAKGSTASGYPTTGYDLMQAYGYDIMSDFMKLEQDLLSKFVDYEEMNDYGEIATALDIFADDATQPSMDEHRTVWATSPDKTLEEMADDLFHRRLRIDDEIWSIARTACSYGNDYEEILVNDEGVQGLNFLAPPTIRRIEGPRGELYGFVQDYKARFGYSPAEYQQILAARNAQRLGMPNQSGTISGMERVTALEDWEVVHFRLHGKHRRSIYGQSILDPCRFIWKRLMLLEDSAMIFRLCLRGDTNIWTTSGYKQIRDVAEGDEVYAYAPGGALKPTRVIYKKHNGKDKIFKIRSVHHDLYANATHPVLVEYETRPGSGRGRRRQRIQEYVEVRNLIPGFHKFVMPHRTSGEEIPIRFPEARRWARIKPAAVASGDIRRTQTYSTITKACGAHQYRIDGLLSGEEEIVAEHAITILKLNGYDPDSLLDFRDDWGGVQNPERLPKVVTEDFARWFGFLIGDGFVGDNCSVGFAAGDDEVTNRRYRNLFESLVGPVSFHADSRSDVGTGAVCVGSKELAELLKLNGFIPGTENKRIPEWVFRADPKIGMAFLEGLLDADGAWKPQHVSKIRKRIRYRRASLELCNKALVEDARQLAMQLGLSARRLRTRVRKGGHTIKGNKRPVKTTVSHTVDIRFCPPLTSEPILGVTEVGEDDIFDIGVEAEEHNFVADGVVVHNTRAPERYAFYVDIGDLPPQEALAYLNRVRQQHKKQKFLDPTTGRLQLKHVPMGQQDDFFVPTRNGAEGTRIEVLGSPSWQSVEDLEYFRSKLFSAMKIPKAYLAQLEGSNRGTLSSEDVRFARSILRIQRELKNGLAKVWRVHMGALNINPNAGPVTLHMTVPSAIFELAQLEVKNARADLSARMQPFFSEYYLLSKIWGLNDDEIQLIMQQRHEDMERNAEMQASAQAVLQRSSMQATMQGQAAGQIDANAMISQAGLSTPPAAAAPAPQVSGQPAQAKESIGPLIRSRGLPKTEYYGLERRLFEKGVSKPDGRLEEKLDKLLASDHQQRDRLQQIGALLKDIAAARRGRSM